MFILFIFFQKSQCQSGGVHPPSKESMKEFVKVARRRMKYISVCGAGGGGMPQDIAAEVQSNLDKKVTARLL